MSELDELTERQEGQLEPTTVDEAAEAALEPEQVAEGEVGVPRPEPVVEVPKIDLNTATADELRRLPGIGPKLAARIVNYRTEIRPFEEPVEITAVPGISETMYARIAERLIVSPVEAMPLPEVEAEAEEIPAPEPEAEIAEAEEIPTPEPEAEIAEAEEIPLPEPERPFSLQVAPPPERGNGWVRLVVVGLLSAVAGAVLALAVVLIINGTLDFRHSDVLQTMWNEIGQLDTRFEVLSTDLSQLQERVEDMEALAPRLDEAQADIRQLSEELATTQAEMRRSVEELGKEVGAVQGDMAALGDHVVGLEENLRAVQRQVGAMEGQLGVLSQELDALREAAHRFDAFLTGLRKLLGEYQETAPRVAPTPYRSKPMTPYPKVTVIPLATPTATPAP